MWLDLFLINAGQKGTMMKHKPQDNGFRKPPEWKKIVALVLVIAMPLLFYYSKSARTQNALNETTQAPQQSQPPVQK
jgi:hypothetical protein